MKTKTEANYRQAEGKRRCGSCTYFKPKNQACTMVQGHISANMVSDIYKAKGKKSAPAYR